jgi:hypothetical protein
MLVLHFLTCGFILRSVLPDYTFSVITAYTGEGQVTVAGSDGPWGAENIQNPLCGAPAAADPEGRRR